MTGPASLNNLRLVDEVHVDALRRQLSDFVARVEAGATFVLLRHGRPIAILGPATRELGGRPLGVSRFRANMRRSIGRADQEPIRLTYRGRTVGFVGPIPEPVKEHWLDMS